MFAALLASVRAFLIPIVRTLPTQRRLVNNHRVLLRPIVIQ